MKKFLTSHRKTSGTVGALVALTIAYVYLFVVPPETAQNGVIQTILIFGHSLCWLFLAFASMLWGFNISKKWYTYAAYAALVTYAIFIVTFITNMVN